METEKLFFQRLLSKVENLDRIMGNTAGRYQQAVSSAAVILLTKGVTPELIRLELKIDNLLLKYK